MIKGEVEAREISDAMKINERGYLEATHKSSAASVGTASSLTVRDQGPWRKRCGFLVVAVSVLALWLGR